MLYTEWDNEKTTELSEFSVHKTCTLIHVHVLLPGILQCYHYNYVNHKTKILIITTHVLYMYNVHTCTCICTVCNQNTCN